MRCVNLWNGSREKKQRKAKTKMGERHHIYVWYNGSSKLSGGGQASILQIHLGSEVLKRICYEKKLIYETRLLKRREGRVEGGEGESNEYSQNEIQLVIIIEYFSNIF